MKFELLQRGYFTIIMSGYVSVSLLREELSISAEEAKKIISKLSEMGIISGIDFSKDKVPFVKKSEAGGQNGEESLKGCCVVDTDVSIHTLKPVGEEVIGDGLLEKAKGLKAKYGVLTTAILQRELLISYHKACLISDSIDDDKTLEITKSK